MDYCIVDENSTIENIIVCDNDEIAHELGALPGYEGAGIGGEYVPPMEWLYDEETGKFYHEEPVAIDETALLRAQVAMLQERQAFLEDCLLEMAEEVYA